MTNVLPFPRARAQSGETTAAEAPLATYKAEILLFTGVRYERHVDQDPPNAGPDTLDGDNNSSARRRKARRRA
jgi:hypothetical protein